MIHKSVVARHQYMLYVTCYISYLSCAVVYIDGWSTKVAIPLQCFGATYRREDNAYTS